MTYASLDKRLAIVRDHELLELIAALDEAREILEPVTIFTINSVEASVDLSDVGKTLERASDHLRELRLKDKPEGGP